jgi:magnesium transporter
MHRTEDIAAVMAHLTLDEQRRLYRSVEDRDRASDLLAHLPEDAVLAITHDLTEEVFADLLDRMDPDDATDVVGLLPMEKRARIIASMEGDEAAEVQELLAWPSDSAGGLMSTAMFTMPDTASCGAAVRELQRVEQELSYVYYVYVVDRDGHLVGVTSLRALVVRPPHTPLAQIMLRSPISVRPETDQEEVARYFERYNLMAIPVVDAANALLGIVTVDDVMDVIAEEAAEDMYRMAGLVESHDPGESLGLVDEVRRRAGWLVVTLVGGVFGAELIAMFEEPLARLPVVAGFIPVILGMGGNVGLQSATIAVRGIATGGVQMSGGMAFALRETRTGMALGLIYGGLLALFGLLRFTDAPAVGIAVGLSALAAMSGSSLVGSGVPLLLRRFGFDPAIATGPLVTLTVDLLGILVYLNIVLLLLPAP